MSKQPMWEKQKWALQQVKQRGTKGVTLFMDRGTGKTRVVIHWLEHLFSRGAKLVYITGPIAALYVWVENWHEFAKAPIAFIDLHETGSAGIRAAKELADQGFPVICLVNYESAWQIGYKRVERKRRGETVKVLEQVDTALHSIEWDAGILDESTAIKTPGSRVSKFFRTKMRPKTTYRAVLTGSGYTKRPLDVWAQIQFSSPGEVFPPTYRAFCAWYAIPHPTIRGAIVGYQNIEDLSHRLSKCAILLKKSDMFDLPPVVHETRKFELSKKARKVYDDITDEMVAELEELEEQGVIITASHVFSVIQKQQQICGGFIMPDPEPLPPDAPPGTKIIRPAPIRLGTEKVEYLMDILDERDSPTIIVVHYDEEEAIVSEAIRKKFGFNPKVLNGRVKGAKARDEMRRAAADDLAFVVKECVAAKGIDLRYADMTIFYSHSYDTEDYEQMLDRNHRGGQTKSITYIHMLYKDSSDMKIMRALERDLSLARQIERNWREVLGR